MIVNEGPRGAVFGRRKGKKLRAGQADLLDALLPRLALDLAGSAPGRLETLFPRQVEGVRLEIGFGGAEHLLSEANRLPQIGFIGVEPFVNGMAKALAGIEKDGIETIRLHHGDASDLLGWLPEGGLDRIDLLYPDPWPKRRQRKRRFVSPERLQALARLLRVGGEFRFATDIDDYAGWTLRHVFASDAFVWTAERPDDWRIAWPDWPGTRYEAKAGKEGRRPTYLRFRRI